MSLKENYEYDKEKVKELKNIIEKSNKIVFLGGAGVSTESGIPDFRSQDGLYNQKYDLSPEYMLSKDCFEEHPDKFYEFYREKILIDNVKPNAAHYALAKLEQEGKLKAIVTQNIDDLHEQAGSKCVYHIHGTIKTYHCPYCGKEYTLEEIKKMTTVPKCDCGIGEAGLKDSFVIKPDVTLYGEMLPAEAWNKSLYHISQADTLIIAGTSLQVYPASTLIDYFTGDNLVIINRDITPRDQWADLVIRGNVGEVLNAVMTD